jgi:hypothetical protein
MTSVGVTMSKQREAPSVGNHYIRSLEAPYSLLYAFDHRLAIDTCFKARLYVVAQMMLANKTVTRGAVAARSPQVPAVRPRSLVVRRFKVFRDRSCSSRLAEMLQPLHFNRACACL